MTYVCAGISYLPIWIDACDMQISFALKSDSNTLVVQAQESEAQKNEARRNEAQKNKHTYELIPHTVLADDFPLFFSSDYHHWADLEAKTIEFRPLAKPWETDPSNWHLKFSTEAGSVMELVTEKGSSFLADVHRALFQSISLRLSPLEDSRYLHVIYSAVQRITVELPRMKLSFFVNDKGDLESRNMKNQVVDKNQSSGTLLGLRNQLLLRAKDPASQDHPQSRTVLIPHGVVHFSIHGNHVSVRIDVGTDREVAFYQYKVDSDLRYLAGSTGLTSRLFKIYLHALTSHCFPDPLTGRTGTEEALYELSEPATSSFDRITEQQAELLKLIGALTPVREYYPVHLRSMQTVHWASLSPLSQHYAFATAVDSVLRRADALRLFCPLKFNPLAYITQPEATLLERAARRSHIYYPVDSTAQLSTVLDKRYDSDQAYTGRDCNPTVWAKAEHAASLTTKMIFTRWNQPTYASCNLAHEVESWKANRIGGPSLKLKLTYNSKWLRLSLPSSWLSVYNLCRHASTSGNQYRLAACLASATYSDRLPENLLHVLLAFATNSSFRSLAPPSHSYYQLEDKYEPDSSRVKRFVSSYRRNLDDSPANNLSRRSDESMYDFGERQDSYYQTHISSLETEFAAALMSQWPGTQPHAPDVYSPWFEVAPCLVAVREYYESCSKNAELRAHLQHIQGILSSQSPNSSLGISASPPVRVNSQQRRQPRLEPMASLSLLPLMCSRIHQKSELSLPQSRPSISKNKGDPTDDSRLASLSAELRRSDNLIHARYGEDLEASRVNLAKAEVISLPNQLPRVEDLCTNGENCRRYLQSLLDKICHSLGPSTPSERVVSIAGVWPRRTPRDILRRLSLWGRQSLPEVWKEALMEYARAFVEYQHTQYLVLLAQDNKKEDFYKELDLESIDSCALTHNPDWLLVQVSNIIFST